MITETEIRQLKFRIPIIIRPDAGGFQAHSPALDGLSVKAETQLEALKKARQAARDFLEIMIGDGMPIPLSILPGSKHASPDEENIEPGCFFEEIKIFLP